VGETINLRGYVQMLEKSDDQVEIMYLLTDRGKIRFGYSNTKGKMVRF
jgi:hypothetical protein